MKMTLVINMVLTFGKYIFDCSCLFIRSFTFKWNSCGPSESFLFYLEKKNLCFQIGNIRPSRHHTCVLCLQSQPDLLVSTLPLLVKSKSFPLPVQYVPIGSRPQGQADLRPTHEPSISKAVVSWLLRALFILIFSWVESIWGRFISP